MNALVGFASVARLELSRRHFVLVAGAALAVLVWILPAVPGLSGLPAPDLRRIASLLVGVGFALGGALLLGASLFGRDLAERRLGFLLCRPIGSASLFAGRLFAAGGLLCAATLLILLPALLGAPASDPVLRNLPLALLAPVSLAILLAANAASVALRSRSPWLAIDSVLLCVATVLVLVASRRLRDAEADGALVLAIAALGILVVAALLAAGLSQVAVGRTDPLRAHGAMSLTFWAFLLPLTLGFDAFSRWVVRAGPDDLLDFRVTSVAPDGPWVTVSGTAARRGEMPVSFLVNTKTRAFVRLGPMADVAFSGDGRRAVFRTVTSRSFGRPAELLLVDLGASRPTPRSTRIEIPVSGASPFELALSRDGRRVAALDEMLRVFEVDTGRLIAAARVDETAETAAGSEARWHPVFEGADHVRLVPAWYPAFRPRAAYRTRKDLGARVIPILDLDLAARRLLTTGSLEASVPTMFRESPDGEILLKLALRARRATMHDARTGAERSECAFAGAGWGGFLSDGRLALLAPRTDASLLVLARRDCAEEERIPLPPAEALYLAGEPAPGVLAVASFGAGTRSRQVLLVDLATRKVTPVRDLTASTSDITFLSLSPVVPGSDGSRLFESSSGELVTLDPRDGTTRRVLARTGL